MKKERATGMGEIIGVGIVCALVLGLGLYAKPPVMPGMPTGGIFPRLPGPPANLSSLLYMLGVGSFMWYAWFLAIPVVRWGAQRVELGGQHFRRTLGYAGATVLALMLVSSVLEFLTLYHGAPSSPRLIEFLPVAARQNLVPWVCVVALVAANEGRRRSQATRLEREQLRAQVAEQRLVALTSQLHPHFLFNTLQGISTLIHRDPNAADEMLTKLSDLLRDLLRHRDDVMVPLSDEMRFTRTYLDIAQIRFADRLRVEVDVDSALDLALVPLFLLQPLVENALSHGIAKQARGGRIAVRVALSGGNLAFDVVDDGPGFTSTREGMGIGNTRERLRASYGDDFVFTIMPVPEGGVVSHVEIPFQTS